MQALTNKHVIVVGAGGNIGSHIVPHLGRIPEVTRVTLVDRDVYEPHNVPTQNIAPSDVGKAKARVQARLLRCINPGLEVCAIAEPVERVPLGALKGDLILAGLDSKRARQVVNECAFRLGMPWIDGGVDGSELLARMTTYIPGNDRPCLECAWDDADYEAVEQTFSCAGVPGEPPATRSPSYLGAIAAALVVNEGRKILTGEHHRVAVGRQVLMEIAHHNYYVSSLRYNPNCRLALHGTAPIGRLESRPYTTTLGELFQGSNDAKHEDAATSIQVLGQTFQTRLTCKRCGHKRPCLRLRESSRHSACRRCGSEMVATGFHSTDRLERVALSRGSLARSLRNIGIRRRDVVRVELAADGARYLEITGGENRVANESFGEALANGEAHS